MSAQDQPPALGDIVKLAGSSTRMVVHDILTVDDKAVGVDGAYVCRWMNDADDLQEANFWEYELRVVEKAK